MADILNELSPQLHKKYKKIIKKYEKLRDNYSSKHNNVLGYEEDNYKLSFPSTYKDPNEYILGKLKKLKNNINNLGKKDKKNKNKYDKLLNKLTKLKHSVREIKNVNVIMPNSPVILSNLTQLMNVITGNRYSDKNWLSLAIYNYPNFNYLLTTLKYLMSKHLIRYYSFNGPLQINTTYTYGYSNSYDVGLVNWNNNTFFFKTIYYININDQNYITNMMEGIIKLSQYVEIMHNVYRKNRNIVNTHLEVVIWQDGMNHKIGIIMDYIPGYPLKNIIDKLTKPQIQYIANQTMYALETLKNEALYGYSKFDLDNIMYDTSNNNIVLVGFQPSDIGKDVYQINAINQNIMSMFNLYL